MAKSSIIITSNRAGKTLQKTLTDVNPAATNAQFATMGTMLTALTNCTYQKTDRITKVNCDTEPGGGTKKEPTLTLSQNTCTNAQVGSSDTETTVTTNSDGSFYTRYDQPSTRDGRGPRAWIMVETNGTAGTGSFRVRAFNDTDSSYFPLTIYIGVTETDNFVAKEVPFTITAS